MTNGKGVADVSHPIANMVAAGMTIMRVENESQQSMATLKPRDENKVYEGALVELELAPEFAKRAWYAIPYKDAEGKTQLVEGPSIKAAMALARRWGNCANAARIVEETDDRITVEGVFIDYETNVRTLRTVSITRRSWSKKLQQVIPLREDRLNMAIQAGMSKAVRNAILSSLPQSLIDTYISRAKSITTKGIKGIGGVKETKSIKERIEDAMKWFVAKGATQEAIKDHIAGLAAETEEDVLGSLQGLATAIKDGQTSIEEAFGASISHPGAPVGQAPNVKDLLGETVKGKGK